MSIPNFKLLESRLELYFQAQGIDIEVSNKEDCLQILLESENIPNKQESLSLIEQILKSSQENKIDGIEVCGRKRHEYSPEWIERLAIDSETVLDLKLLESKLELYFQVKGIDIKISSKSSYLQVLLESENAPSSQKCLLLIEQILKDSQEKRIDAIKVYGRIKSEDFPEWVEELKIDNKTKLDFVSLAQKRNIEAIVALLERDLNAKSIDIKASWKEDCLQIILLSELELDRKFATTIKDFIFDLNIENCQKVKICSQLTNDDFPDWLKEFYNEKLPSHENESKPITVPSTTTKLASAKQGNSDAIAYCLNYLLQKHQIITTVVVRDSWLEVTLQGNNAPDRDFLISYITNFVHKLKLTQINTLQIQAWQKGETCQSWNQTISLV